VQALQADGFSHVQASNLYGCERAFLENPPGETARDIDVLFVGNFHPAVQRERLTWLGRLAPLAARWKVLLTTGVFRDDYRALLQRARIVFNRSIRGECNSRAFEAAAAGALLFQEADNQEVSHYFRDCQEYVAYRPDDLETLLEHYLSHEEERRAIAEAGRQRAQQYAFSTLWQQTLDQIANDGTALHQRASSRQLPQGEETLLLRAWQRTQSGPGLDPTLVRDLEQTLASRPHQAGLLNALAVVLAYDFPKPNRRPPAVLDLLQRAWAADANHLIGGLNLAEALAATGQGEAAVEQARHTLDRLDRCPLLTPTVLDAPSLPPGFDLFRVEWERTAWAHAGRPEDEARAKSTLLRWRLHSLLATLTGRLAHYYESASARPDLAASQAALGCALARVGQGSAALPYLRRAVAGNPFDLPAARALFQALGEAQLWSEQHQLAQSCRLLHQSAPSQFPEQDWFAPPPLPSIPASPSTTEDNGTILWEGAFQALHSLALVNRELCGRLLDRGVSLNLRPTDHPDEHSQTVPLSSQLAECCHPATSGPIAVTVQHRWPPRWVPPEQGLWVVIQPWEYGSLPKSWLLPLTTQVDAVWAYSSFIRSCYIQSGVPAQRVHVVPLGVDVEGLQRPQPPFPLQTRKRFKFLFVGGTIRRKGIDLLLRAYTETFSTGDDVCLVIKDMGVGSFYRGQTAEQVIARYQKSGGPEIEYLAQELTAEQMAALYQSCDCLVHPYRGEGFGLPIAEAMACGKPVIVTGYGPALDFCNPDNAYLLPAQRVPFRDNRVGDIETVGRPWLVEPDVAWLRRWIAHVAAHPEEARLKGEAAAEHIRNYFTWDHTAATVLAQLDLLATTRSTAQRSAPALTHLTSSSEPRPSVSLCLIVKNEEQNLPACLASAADLVGEVIVVDTGSTDRTREIAQSFGATVFEFPWVDNFAAARNECLRHATGEWIFWLDADDRVDEADRTRLKSLFASLSEEKVAYVMKCLCLPGAATATATVVDHVRLFRNHPAIRWEHRVHEQILPALRRQGHRVQWSDVVIQHTGYQDPRLRGRKLERDLRLLQLEQGEQPDHPFTLFNLGSVYQELGRVREALPLLRRSLKLSHPSDSIVRKLYALLAGCHRRLNEPAEALAVCREGLRVCPEDAELLFLQAIIRLDRNDLGGAEADLTRLLTVRPREHFASVADGLRGYKARHNLGLVYRRQHRPAEAEAQWHAAVAECREFVPAWLELGESYLEQKRWDDLDRAVKALTAASAALEATVFRARGHLARREFGTARAVLQPVLWAHPRAVWPRVVLSHVLLQEGKDLDAAEQVLREVLQLDPQHAQANQNLAVLLRQRQRQVG
jgi:glycosyltransferase involved in cell wall biosynthesis/Flp pilus assembly protein TadD